MHAIDGRIEARSTHSEIRKRSSLSNARRYLSDEHFTVDGHGLIVSTMVTEPDRTAERDAVAPGLRDSGCDTYDAGRRQNY
jgi:hypothetical protein